MSSLNLKSAFGVSVTLHFFMLGGAIMLFISVNFKPPKIIEITLLEPIAPPPVVVKKSEPVAVPDKIKTAEPAEKVDDFSLSAKKIDDLTAPDIGDAKKNNLKSNQNKNKAPKLKLNEKPATTANEKINFVELKNKGQAEIKYYQSMLVYQGELVARLKRFWRPDINSKGLETLIVVNIAPSGQMQSFNLEKSSGNSNFDTRAINALKLASPFGPLPSDFPTGSVLVVPFKFNNDKINF